MGSIFNSAKATALNGEIKVPGDKSMSHRSIMFGALAEGVTQVSGFLRGEDCLSTMTAFQDLGVKIKDDGETLTIHGVGMHGLRQANKPLDMGNSGTAMRLMAGLLSAQAFDSELIGDASLSKRPMGRIIKPLGQMGAVISASKDGSPPLQIRGGQSLTGIHYDMPMASAQVKSAVLLAGLYAEGTTAVTEPGVTRDHSERMLKGFGYDVAIDGSKASLQGGGKLKARDIKVPGDISSAAFFLVAGSIVPDSEITLTQVGMNPTRIGVIKILRLMGGDITLKNEQQVGGEPVADLTVRSASLRGIQIPEELVPLAIDEFPVLFVAASCAQGQTRLTGAKELRVKESDRIGVMAEGLSRAGIECQVFPDGLVIEGGALSGVEVDSQHDHRIAMAFAVAGLVSEGPMRITGCETVATSFPNFVETVNALGGQLNVESVN